MATYQIGFTGTPNQIFNSDTAYVTRAVASPDIVVAPASGTCTKMFVWKDTALDDVEVEVGIYDDTAGDPVNLLGGGTKSTGWSAGWNEITISSVSIVSGNTYHPSVLVLSGAGNIGYDTTAGNTSYTEPNESSLPDPWPTAFGQNYAFAVYAEYDDAGGSVSPNDLTLSSIILEQTKATPTIIADDLILSSIILESPIVSAVVSPDNLILSAIILQETSIGGTVSPDDLILSSIILESPGVSGIISPDSLVLSSIILEQAIIIPSVIPDNLVLSAIILEQTKQSGEIEGPISISISLAKSNISMGLAKSDISISLKKSNISMELIT